MNITVPLALFGWPVVAALLFHLVRPRVACLLTYLVAALLLPEADYNWAGLPRYDKWTAAALATLAGTVCFQLPRLTSFRPGWIDLPMAVWCVVPLASALANDFGVYDGVSASLRHVILWGTPYLAGRLYLSGPAGLRALALAVVAGGLIYVPLCLLEMRLSPQLHRWVYGFHPHTWLENARYGGWRPVVFMSHGLSVGLWMSASALCAVWLRVSGTLRLAPGIPMIAAAFALLVAAVLCKSTGAVVLLAVGLAVLEFTRRSGRTFAVALLLLVPFAYAGVRCTGLWSGGDAVAAAGLLSPERAESLGYRFQAEDVLVRHALKRPVLGWSGYGRNRPVRFDPEAVDVAIDGLWIIALGSFGFVGLLALGTALSVPGFVLWRRLPVRGWTHPAAAPAAALAVVVALFAIDCLSNAMINGVYILASGALAASVTAQVSTPAPASEEVAPGGQRIPEPSYAD